MQLLNAVSIQLCIHNHLHCAAAAKYFWIINTLNFNNVRADIYKKNYKGNKLLPNHRDLMMWAYKLKSCVLIAYNECHPIFPFTYHILWCLCHPGTNVRGCLEAETNALRAEGTRNHQEACSIWRVRSSGFTDENSMALTMDLKKPLASQICHHPCSLWMSWALFEITHLSLYRHLFHIY